MYKVVLMLLLSVSVSAWAHTDLGPREEHGNPEDEKRCFKEIRQLDCGQPEQHKTFISCVDSRVDELSEHCQAFHKDEKDRMSGHGH